MYPSPLSPRSIANQRHRGKRRRHQEKRAKARSLVAFHAAADSNTTTPTTTIPTTLQHALSPLSWLRRPHRALVDYFISSASGTVISSRQGQNTFCSTIVPLALQSPPLLYATLAYSAAQLATDTYTSMTTELIDVSLAALQAELSRPKAASTPAAKVSLLATSLMLCLVSISMPISHVHDHNTYGGSSWRVHFEGAKALLSDIRRSATPPRGANLDPILHFLSRWYLSIEALVALTPTGLATGQCVIQDYSSGTVFDPNQTQDSEHDVCDDHFGYSTKLALLFREIGASAWERRRNLHDNHRRESSLEAGPDAHVSLLTQRDFDRDADLLDGTLTQIFADAYSTRDMKFYPGVRAGLTDNEVIEFSAVTEAYAHMARILIERRVRGTPCTDHVVWAAMHSIIQIVATITPAAGASPWQAIVPPLFTAGCEATADEDRDALRNVFRRLTQNVRYWSLQRCWLLLEKLWADSNRESLNWLDFQEKNNWDILTL